MEYLIHKPSRWKVVTVYGINLGIFLVLYIISSYLLYRVYRSFRFSDKPMLASILCAHCSLGILVVYNSIMVDINIYRDDSLFERTNMVFALSTTLLGFILECVILLGLIFDLYKWWLFISMTTYDEGFQEYNEQIMDQTKKLSEAETNKL